MNYGKSDAFNRKKNVGTYSHHPEQQKPQMKNIGKIWRHYPESVIAQGKKQARE